MVYEPMINAGKEGVTHDYLSNANTARRSLPLFMKYLWPVGKHTSINLPPYVVINDPNCPNGDVLNKMGQPFTFPLSAEDLAIIKTLEAKYDSEEN